MKKLIVFFAIMTQIANAQKKDKYREDKTLEDITFNEEWNQYFEVRMKNKTKVMVASEAAPLLLEIKDLDLNSIVKEAFLKYKELKDNTLENDAVKVIFTENMNSEITWPNPNKKTLEIQPTTSQNKKFGLLKNNETVILKSTKDTLEIKLLYAQLPYKYAEKVNQKKLKKCALDLKISFVLNDINELDTLDISKIKADIERQIDILIRLRGTEKILNNPGLPITSASTFGTKAMRQIVASKQQDELSINGNFGLALIRDKVVPELHLNLMIRKNPKMALGIGVNQLYFWQKASEDKSYKLVSNTFLSTIFNFYKTKNANTKPLFITGLELGYLTNRTSPYFYKNTFRFGVVQPISKKVSLLPEFYFNFSEKKSVFPSLKLRVGI
jgi:hypothetical protein